MKKLTIFSALLMCIILNFLPAMAENTVSMEYKFKGNGPWILSYRLVTDITTSGNEINFVIGGREIITTKKLAGGNFEYTATGDLFKIEKGPDISPNQLGMLAPNQKLVLEIKPNGEVVKKIKYPMKGEHQYPFIFPLPSKKFRVGDIYNEKTRMDVPNIGKSKIETWFKLLSVDGKIARFRGRNRLSKRDKDFDAHSKNEIKYDTVNGIITRGRVKTNLDVTLNQVKLEQSIFFNWDMRPYKVKKTSIEEEW